MGKPPPKLIEKETIEYLHRIELLLDGEEEIDDPQVFVNNVLEEVKANPTSVIMDPEGSRVIEKVLRIATHENLFTFFKMVFGRLEELCFHRNGSHVIQTLLCLTPAMIDEEIASGIVVTDYEGQTERDQSNPAQSTQELLFDMCAVMMDGWINLAFDAYGSHIFRVILNILSGRKPDTLSRSKASINYNLEKNNTFKFDAKKKKKGGKPAAEVLKDPFEEEFEELREVPEAFHRLSSRITVGLLSQLNDEDFSSMAVDPVASPVLQLLMLVQEKNPEVLSQIVTRFLCSTKNSNVAIDGENTESSESSEDKGKQYVQNLITHPIGSHVMQRLLQVCPANLHSQLYNEHFRHNIKQFCQHNIANFVVSSLVKGMKNETLFGLILDELSEVSELLMTPTRANIIRQTVAACVTFPKLQKTVMKIVTTGLHATTALEKQNMFKLVIYLCKLEDLGKLQHVNPLGTLVAQGLFAFHPNLCKPLIDSFLAISTEEIFQWSLDPMGSRAVESFLKGINVDISSKTKLIKRLNGRFVDLSLNKFGSHIVDLCWGHSTIEMKESIVQELAERDRDLQNNFHGKFVYRNCKVESYKSKKQEWRDKEASAQRKKEMFQDIIEENERQKTQVNAVLEKISKEHDPAMAALGFGKRAPKKGPAAPKESDANNDDEMEEFKSERAIVREIEQEINKRKKGEDEIDDLFSSKRRKTGKEQQEPKKQKTKEEDEDEEEAEPEAEPEAEEEEDEEEQAAKPSTPKKISKDLEAILGAIEGTKKKKKTTKAEAEAPPKPKKVPGVKETLEEKMKRIKEEQQKGGKEKTKKKAFSMM